MKNYTFRGDSKDFLNYFFGGRKITHFNDVRKILKLSFFEDEKLHIPRRSEGFLILSFLKMENYKFQGHSKNFEIIFFEDEKLHISRRSEGFLKLSFLKMKNYTFQGGSSFL